MQGEMILSIVMITIPERIEAFKKLFHHVQAQIDACHEVHPSLGMAEIVPVVTAKYTHGGPSIGKKRQTGLELARGKYVCWLDDDDWVSPDYVETIIRLAQNDSDILTFNNFSKLEGYWMTVIMRLKYKEDEQPRPGIIKRRPYHVCAFKKKLLTGIEFPDMNWDEDTEFILKALERCKTESHSKSILHQYNREKREDESWRKDA